MKKTKDKILTSVDKAGVVKLDELLDVLIRDAKLVRDEMKVLRGGRRVRFGEA